MLCVQDFPDWRALRKLAALLVALAGAPQIADAQALPCTMGRIIGASPGANATLQVCLPSLRSDSAFVALVERMNRIAEESADSRKRVERLVQALGTTSTELSEQQLRTLAKSVTDRLGAISRDSENRLSRRMELLSNRLEDLQDKVTEARKNPDASARTNTAFAGAGGDAVARLDLDAASRIFDQLGTIDRHVQDVGAKVETVVADVKTLRDNAALANAFQLLNELAKSKPRGDLGQSLAVRTLLAEGRQFRGLDLSGLSFAGELPAIDLGEASLQMSDFSNAKMAGAQLQKANLTAATLAGSNLSRANLTQSYLPFTRAAGAVFDNANLARSSWVAADLQRASFRNADLRGANFEMADLRDADMRGAKLTNAFLGGSDLRGAKFDQAEIVNTDVVAAVLSTASMSAAQRSGLCSSSFDRKKDFTIYDDIPSSKYESGLVYDELLAYRKASIFWSYMVDKAFPRCATLPADAALPMQAPVYDGKWRSDYRQHMKHSLLGVAGRADEFVGIVLERIASVNARTQAAAEIAELAPVRAAQRKRLDDRLTALSRDAKPSKTPLFSEYADTQIVLLRRLSPATLEALKPDWSFITRDDFSAWPRLFENNDVQYYSDRNATTTDAFKAWVSQRAKAWQDGVVIHQAVLVNLLNGASIDADFTGPLARLLGTSAERLSWGPNFGLAESKDIKSVLMFDDTFDSARAYLVSHPEVGRGQSFNLEIRAARLVDMPNVTHEQLRRLIVWTVRVAGIPGTAK